MLETFLCLFVFGGFWFWTVVVLSSIAIIGFLENDKTVGATVVCVSTLAATFFLGNIGVFGMIVENPWWVVGVIASYFVIGALWGIVKWGLFLRHVRERYQEAKEKFLADCSKLPIPQIMVDDYKQSISSGILVGLILEKWRTHVKEYESDIHGYGASAVSYQKYRRSIVKPLVSDHKARILTWMSYWPWSCLWTLLNDPIRKLFKHIYYRIKGTLQKMSDRVFRSIDAELSEDNDVDAVPLKK